MENARSGTALVWFGLGCIVLGGVSGCEPSAPLERAGIALTVPGSWQPVDPLRWRVPGTALAAWSGPDGSSLVIYETLPAPASTAESLAQALGNRLTNLPELKVLAMGSQMVAGQSAAQVEIVAPGSGAALAPSGIGKPIETEGKPLIPTRQLTIGFPRSRGSLFVSWHTPQESHEKLAPEIKSMLDSIKLRADTAQSTSHY